MAASNLTQEMKWLPKIEVWTTNDSDSMIANVLFIARFNWTYFVLKIYRYYLFKANIVNDNRRFVSINFIGRLFKITSNHPGS